MSALDQAEVDTVVARMEPLIKRYYESKDEMLRKRLDVELESLSAAEAAIMRKYNLNYRDRQAYTGRCLHIDVYASLQSTI